MQSKPIHAVNQDLMIAVLNRTIKKSAQKLFDEHDPQKTGTISYMKHKNDILFTLEEIYCEAITMTCHEFDRSMKDFDSQGSSTFDKGQLINFFKEVPQWLEQHKSGTQPPPLEVERPVIAQ